MKAVCIDYKGKTYVYKTFDIDDADLLYAKAWFVTRNKPICPDPVKLEYMADLWICKKKYNVQYDKDVEKELAQYSNEFIKL